MKRFDIAMFHHQRIPYGFTPSYCYWGLTLVCTLTSKLLGHSWDLFMDVYAFKYGIYDTV